MLDMCAVSLPVGAEHILGASTERLGMPPRLGVSCGRR